MIRHSTRWLRVAWWAALVGLVEVAIGLAGIRRQVWLLSAALAVSLALLAHDHQSQERHELRPQVVITAGQMEEFRMAPIPNWVGPVVADPIPLASGRVRVMPIVAPPSRSLDDLIAVTQ